jgi:hypothetical protein
MKALPKILYVKIDQPENSDPYLMAGETQRELAEMNETVTVGKYQLVETAKVQMVEQVTVTKR